MALFAPNIVTPDSALGGAEIERSLRIFTREAQTPDQVLTRTGFGNGDRQRGTISVWFKWARDVGHAGAVFTTGYSGSGGSQSSMLMNLQDMTSDYGYWFGQNDNNGPTWRVRSPFKMVDDQWYHFVIAINTTADTDSNRVKIYINGTQDTALASWYGWPSQNSYTRFLQDNFRWGAQDGGGSPSNMTQFYTADLNVIDGTNYSASDFGYTDDQTGIWKPKELSGINYGSKGFRLEFKDNSGTSATTLGKDTSGNGNNCTPSNFSVTADHTNDSMLDTPTNNYCTMSQNYRYRSGITVRYGNLRCIGSNSGESHVFGTLAVNKGKWYYEVTKLTNTDTTKYGFVGTKFLYSKNSGDIGIQSGNAADGTGMYWDSRQYLYGMSGSEYTELGGYTTDDVLGVAFDVDKNTFYWAKNGTWLNSADPAAGTGGYVPNDINGTHVAGDDYVPYFGGSNGGEHAYNFGQQGFKYTPPAGFRAINSKNLASPEPAGVIRPQRHFGILNWNGNDGSQTIDGLEFTPDFVWIKARRSGEHHFLTDVVRGAGKRLQTSSANPESDRSSEVTSFVRGGITVSGTHNEINGGGVNILAMCWKAGGAAVSNNDGSVTSTISANQEAGFSIVQFESQTTNIDITVGHGLGKKPAFWMWKSIDNTIDWYNYHQSIGYDGWINMSSASGSTTGNDAAWKAEPTSTVLTHGSGLMNQNTIIMYVWAEIKGYSKFGVYQGNGNSTHGTYVECGFKPAFIIYKKTSGSDYWEMQNNIIDTYNPVNESLFPNRSDAQSTGRKVDFLANGFIHRNGNGNTNEDGHTYIFMAWAEHPGENQFGVTPHGK